MISQKLFQRSFYTTSARAFQLQAKPQRFGSPPATVSMLQPKRFVASSVGSRPASQNLKHAALNIKEEVGNSAADAARSIAGGNMATDYVPTDKTSSFVSSPSSYLISYVKRMSKRGGATVDRCYKNRRRRRSHTLPHVRTRWSAPLSWHIRHCDLSRQPSRSRSSRSTFKH